LKVLVTGGAGYLGCVLVAALLERGHRVRVLDSLLYGGSSLLNVWSHPQFEFIRGDVCDGKCLQSSLNDIEAVVHLAAVVGDLACTHQPELARSVNLDASVALLSESRKAGVSRFVFASTCSNYGKMKNPSQYVDETSALKPLSLYAETKVVAERAILDSAGRNALCTTSLRLATLFGVSPRMRFDLTANDFTLNMLAKKRLVVYGEQFWRPYVHVRDAALAILCVLDTPIEKVKNQVFNVGSTDQNYQKRHLVELIRPYAPDAVVEYVHKEEDPRDYRVSFAKIKGVLGFEITRTVSDGICEIIGLINNKVIQDFEDTRYHN